MNPKTVLSRYAYKPISVQIIVLPRKITPSKQTEATAGGYLGAPTCLVVYVHDRTLILLRNRFF